MKHYALLGGLLLAGCATTPNQPNPLVGQVQVVAQQVCSYLPALETVAAIVALGVPYLSTAEQIADAICQTVVPHNKSLKKLALPMVRGVAIHGHFIH